MASFDKQITTFVNQLHKLLKDGRHLENESWEMPDDALLSEEVVQALALYRLIEIKSERPGRRLMFQRSRDARTDVTAGDLGTVLETIDGTVTVLWDNGMLSSLTRERDRWRATGPWEDPQHPHHRKGA